MILSTLLMVAVLLGGTCGETDVEDFDDKLHGYEIIFHDTQNLLLVIHAHSCYFVSAPDNKENSLVDDPQYILSNLQMTEDQLVDHIINNRSGEVKPTTLRAMRNRYQDVLADFHCLSKDIYEMGFYSGNNAATTSSPTPTCVGKSDGMHADPRDCHKFIECTHDQIFFFDCPAGTGFQVRTRQCARLDDLPHCA